MHCIYFTIFIYSWYLFFFKGRPVSSNINLDYFKGTLWSLMNQRQYGRVACRICFPSQCLCRINSFWHWLVSLKFVGNIVVPLAKECVSLNSLQTASCTFNCFLKVNSFFLILEFYYFYWSWKALEVPLMCTLRTLCSSWCTFKPGNNKQLRSRKLAWTKWEPVTLIAVRCALRNYRCLSS